MDSNEVTRRQARVIMARVGPMRDYLFRLRSRMEQRGFTREDRLFALVKAAELAIGELYVDVEFQMRCGPVEVPPQKRTAWLEQKSARKRHDRR
jgi:hypothetical protein